MIRYDLRCIRQHHFEAWFRNAADYDRQQEENAVACPICGSLRVSKAIMAPAVASRQQSGDNGPAEAITPVASDPERETVADILRQLHRHVAEHADYVGDRFPEEARRIHYGETEQRAIYGEATPQEAKALVEEGIDLQPLPAPPEESN
jgi:hypothetical protein